MTDRYQRVHITDVYSSWYNLKQGVPQGTVLGPLHFNLYVNDLKECIHNQTHLIQYADDCLVFSNDKNPQVAKPNLTFTLEQITTYFKQHELNLNASKTEYIKFLGKTRNKSKQKETIVVDGKLIRGKMHLAKI